MQHIRKNLLGVTVVIVIALVGCGDDSGDANGDPGANGDPDATFTIQLTESLEPVVEALIAAGDLEEATFSIATRKADIVGALESERPPDVVIGAHLWIEELEVDPRPFGRNLAEIITPPGNPAGVSGPADFASGTPFRTLVCGGETELGHFGKRVLQRADVTPDPDTVVDQCESEAVDLLTSGDLDAALVFRLELGPQDEIDRFEVPEDANLIFELSYFVGRDSPEAEEFVTFLESDAGRELRTEFGALP